MIRPHPEKIIITAALILLLSVQGCIDGSLRKKEASRSTQTIQPRNDTEFSAEFPKDSLSVQTDSSSLSIQTDLSVDSLDFTTIDEDHPGTIQKSVLPDDSLKKLLENSSLDSLSRDSTDLVMDTTLTEEENGKEDTGPDTTITYSAENIVFNMENRTTTLTGRASIEYRDMKLEANEIVVDWRHNLMSATGRQDTVFLDSARTIIDSIVTVGLPTFYEGRQKMTGDFIKVNLKNKKGYVVGGRSKYDFGYYHGDEIYKVDQKVMYVRDGSFTSCDLPEPHYSFTSNKMKMLTGDKVVGKPVILRFKTVPVFALPFAVFSTKRGRRSGLIVPTYGENESQGRHLRNLGYYYAASDYWDGKLLLDFYEKLGISLRGNLVYNKRYQYQGGLSGSWLNQAAAGGGRRKRWDLRIRHNQNIDESSKLAVDGTFISDGSYYSDISNNISTRLDQKIRSNATYTKSWPGTRASMSVNLSHEQNLVTDENYQTLPSISFRLGSAPLFPSKEKRKRRDVNLVYTPPEPATRESERKEKNKERWYNQITMSYSSRLDNRRSKKLISKVFEESFKSGAQHNLSFNAPQKVFRHFNLTPALSYREDWFNERKVWYYDESGNLDYRTDHGFFQRRSFSSSLSTNTKIYGYFNINRGSIKTIRHVLTPSIRLNYKPDFGVPQWGMYQQVEKWEREYDDPDSLTFHMVLRESVRKDRYEGSVYGGSPRGKQMSLGFSLSNLFQMKRVKVDEKGEEKELKTDLFTYTMSTNYNFAADSLRFSPLSSTFRANPVRQQNRLGPLEKLSIDLSTSHSFYQYVHDPQTGTGKQVNQFYWDESGHGLNLLRLTNFSTTSSFALSGKSPFAAKTGKGGEGEESTDDEFTDDIENINREMESRFDERGGGLDTRRARGGSPWRITGSIRYNLRLTDPRRPSETIRTSATCSVKMTKNWDVTYSTQFDLKTRKVISSNLNLVRDLHCWQGRLTWNPRGLGKGFYLWIGIKASQLRDIKIEQRKGRTSSGLGSLY